MGGAELEDMEPAAEAFEEAPSEVENQAQGMCHQTMWSLCLGHDHVDTREITFLRGTLFTPCLSVPAN